LFRNLKTIINNIDRFTKAIEPLSETESASYESKEGKANFNLTLKFDAEEMEDLITSEIIESESKMILKVKKPDYLGESKWLFKHGDRSIEAKILAKDWLQEFQDRKHDIRPQDSLVCKVKTTAKYDHNNELINHLYEIIEVIEIRTENIGGEQLEI